MENGLSFTLKRIAAPDFHDLGYNHVPGMPVGPKTLDIFLHSQPAPQQSSWLSLYPSAEYVPGYEAYLPVYVAPYQKHKTSPP